MAFSKKHLYPLADQRVAEYCKAIAYPGRIDALRTLHYHGKLTVKELYQHQDSALSSIHPISEESFSDHLAILRNAHLITPEERFPYTFYKIHEDNVQQAALLITAYFSLFSK